MKICIMTSAHKAFDVRIFEKQATSLANAGFDVTIINKEFSGEKNGVKFIKANISQKRYKRIMFGPSDIYKVAKNLNADVYHFHDPELMGIALKLKKTSKVIFDVHEDTARQILTKEWIPLIFRKISSIIFEKREKNFAKKFDKVVLATPFIEKVFKEKGCINTLTINNYPLKHEIFFGETNFEKKQDSVCYIGGITKIRGVI
jgi:hypothetical protein